MKVIIEILTPADFARNILTWWYRYRVKRLEPQARIRRSRESIWETEPGTWLEWPGGSHRLYSSVSPRTWRAWRKALKVMNGTI